MKDKWAGVTSGSRRIAFLFPGQGAQTVGMGRDLLAADSLARDLMDRASHAAGVDLGALCARGPASALADTRYLQPALTAMCLGLACRLREAGITPHVVAGHSIGELSALATSGAADPFDMVSLAAIRGRLMGEAADARPGIMVAISGLPFSAVTEAALSFAGQGTLSIAAVNAPAQVTLSGDAAALLAFTGSLEPRGRFKVTRLEVLGAWHSAHMAQAVAPFTRALEAIPLVPPEVPMVLNSDGRESGQPEAIRDLIAGQLVRPVRFDLVMAELLARSITDFVEIGPGKVLRGLVRLNSNDPALSVNNVSDLRSLDRAIAFLRGQR